MRETTIISEHEQDVRGLILSASRDRSPVYQSPGKASAARAVISAISFGWYLLAAHGPCGWPTGFWWAELTPPYCEFIEHGYKVDVYSPDRGKLDADSWSDPRDAGKLMADDLISLGFINSSQHSVLIDDSKTSSQLKVDDYDAILFVDGQGPMYTFYDNDHVHKLVVEIYRAGKITAVLCYATCLLLKSKVDGTLLVTGKTWTGFENCEEKYADEFVGRRMQPSGIEDEAKKLPDSNFIVSGRFKAHVVRDGNLIVYRDRDFWLWALEGSLLKVVFNLYRPGPCRPSLFRVVWLTLALFLSHLSVAMSLPVMSVQGRMGRADALPCHERHSTSRPNPRRYRHRVWG